MPERIEIQRTIAAPAADEELARTVWPDAATTRPS